MMLRRVTEHVKTQNWFAVGLDFVRGHEEFLVI